MQIMIKKLEPRGPFAYKNTNNFNFFCISKGPRRRLWFKIAIKKRDAAVLLLIKLFVSYKQNDSGVSFFDRDVKSLRTPRSFCLQNTNNIQIHQDVKNREKNAAVYNMKTFFKTQNMQLKNKSGFKSRAAYDGLHRVAYLKFITKILNNILVFSLPFLCNFSLQTLGYFQKKKKNQT